jgi:hypothetical protein
MKLRAKKRLAFTVTQEFINRFVEEKRKKAKHSRRAASDLERTMRALANAPTTNTPPGPPKSGPVAPAAPPATTDSALPAQTPQKIEPQSSRSLPASRQSSKRFFRQGEV